MVSFQMRLVLIVLCSAHTGLWHCVAPVHSIVT